MGLLFILDIAALVCLLAGIFDENEGWGFRAAFIVVGVVSLVLTTLAIIKLWGGY